MSSKDKTREKLVGSMRKTKTAAGITPEQPDTQTAPAATEADKTIKPAPPRQTRTAEAARPEAKPGNAGGYQSGRRVWPD